MYVTSGCTNLLQVHVHVCLHKYLHYPHTCHTRVWPQTGESLVDGEHYASHEIEARVEELFAKWEELLEAKRLGLEQALSLVHYGKVCTYV